MYICVLTRAHELGLPLLRAHTAEAALGKGMVATPSHGREGQHPGIRLPGCFWVPGTQLEMQLDSPFHLCQAHKL